MRKVLFVISFVFTISIVYPNNELSDKDVRIDQSRVSVSGSKPKAGDIISGIVKNEDIPVVYRGIGSGNDVINEKGQAFVDSYMAYIIEKNFQNEVVVQTKTDVDGRFSFKLVDPSDSLQIIYGGFKGLSIPFTGKKYTIYLVRDPNICTNETDINPVDLYAYPVLILDGYSLETDSTYWKDLDPGKDYFTNDELAALFGIKSEEIKNVWIFRGDEAIEFLGDRGRSGVFVIQTKEGNMGRLFKERLEKEIGNNMLRRGK